MWERLRLRARDWWRRCHFRCPVCNRPLQHLRQHFGGLFTGIMVDLSLCPSRDHFCRMRASQARSMDEVDCWAATSRDRTQITAWLEPFRADKKLGLDPEARFDKLEMDA